MDAHPPIYPPAYPPPRRPASFWVAVILAFMLLGSMLFNLVLVVGSAVATTEKREHKFKETVVAGDPDATDKVLNINVDGTIMGDSGEDGAFARPDLVTSIQHILKQARKDDDIKAVLLEVNSPGGGITASDVIYHELATYSRERNVPIVAMCQDLTASGGYYISMAAQHVMAHETSMVGSIGVIAQFPNFSGLMQEVGVKVNVIKSERYNGEESFKDIGSPYRVLKPAERKFLQTLINQMWGRFVDVVATGRKGKLTRAQIQALADGRIWTGKMALDLKLVDALGYRDDAWKEAAKRGKAPEAKLVRYHLEQGLLSALMNAQTRQDQRLDRVLSRLDPHEAPRVMYLWTGR